MACASVYIYNPHEQRGSFSSSTPLPLVLHNSQQPQPQLPWHPKYHTEIKSPESQQRKNQVTKINVLSESMNTNKNGDMMIEIYIESRLGFHQRVIG